MFAFPIFLAFFGLIVLLSGIFAVKQQTAVLVERFGKFHSIKQSGLQFKIPFFDRIAGRVTLKIQQLDVIVETKTKDNVFVKLKVSVQFRVLQDAVYEAFYKLENPHEQITAYVFDTVRAEVPKMKLDEVFERKDDIAVAIRRELEEAMNEYGFGIVKALVTDIDPDIAVKNAMNRINAAERQKLAAEYDGEAERIRIVAKAKAEAESKRLQGQGIANQRREIARGQEESVDILNNVGINSQEASALIVVTQHYDTLQSLGEHANSNLILLPNAPSAATDMLNNMVTSFAASQQISSQMGKPKAKPLQPGPEPIAIPEKPIENRE
ncbi:MAG: SPFH domain-containing protein [Haliscomenobacter sp.]